MKIIRKSPSGTLHFGFRHVKAEPNDENWITASWITKRDHTLMLLADQQHGNEGASLTNAMEASIAHVSQYVPDIRKTLFVQLDSDGQFDLVAVNWNETSRAWPGGPRAPEVGWEPLKAGDHIRTIEAFAAFAGESAAELLSNLGLDMPRNTYYGKF